MNQSSPSPTAYDEIENRLVAAPRTWLVTGVAGFIGSNLLENLLLLNQKVVGLDNFSTGYKENLDNVRSLVDESQWARFFLINGDIRQLGDCQEACNGVDFVLHQAALGSVPRSIADPITTNSNNIDGFLNMLVAARDANVLSFTYAASSSTYGDHPSLPKVEEVIGNPLSPYAVTKLVNELYAKVFERNYAFDTIGLRYFNVFGRRQNPNGAYAAVIPRWIYSLISNEPISINGDGQTSRDFSYVDNVVQANILAATAADSAKNNIYNIAVGDQTTLNQLVDVLRESLLRRGLVSKSEVTNGSFRQGDVRHSLADIGKARAKLGYLPEFDLRQGVDQIIDWYLDAAKRN